MTETSSNSKRKVSRHKINEKDSRISCWCLKMDENIFDFFFKISENVTVLFSELCVVFGRSAPSSDCSNDLQVNRHLVQLSSVESLSRVRLLRPHELQRARPPCPSPTPGVHSDSRPSSRWCHQVISSSVVPFSSCPQSLPASESFPMSQLFAWGGQTTGVSALASFLLKTPRTDFL